MVRLILGLQGGVTMWYVELSVHIRFSIPVWSLSRGRDGCVLQRDEHFDILDGCGAVLWGIRLMDERFREGFAAESRNNAVARVSALSRDSWGLKLVVCISSGSQYTETSGTHFELALNVPCQY